MVKGKIELRQNNFESAFKYFYEIMYLDPDNKHIYDMLEEAENLCRNIAIIHEGMIVEHSDMATLLSYINVNHFILDLDKPLRQPPEIPGYQFELASDKILNVGIPKKNSLNQLFEQLSAYNIQVKSLKNKSNRLEQLFMDIVQ